MSRAGSPSTRSPALGAFKDAPPARGPLDARKGARIGVRGSVSPFDVHWRECLARNSGPGPSCPTSPPVTSGGTRRRRFLGGGSRLPQLQQGGRTLLCQSPGIASTEHSTGRTTSDREPLQGLVAVETEKLPVLPTWLSARRVVQTRKSGLESVGSALPGPGKVRDLNPKRVQDVSLRARPEAQSHPARAVKGAASEDQAMPDLAPHKDLGAGPAVSGVLPSEGHPKDSSSLKSYPVDELRVHPHRKAAIVGPYAKIGRPVEHAHEKLFGDVIRAGTPVQHRLDLLVEDLDYGAVLVAASLVFFSEVPPVRRQLVHRGELLSLGPLQRQRTTPPARLSAPLAPAARTPAWMPALPIWMLKAAKGLLIEAPDGAVPQFDGNATWLPPVVARE